MDAGRGLLETSGSAKAHIKLRSPADIDRAALTDMVRVAVRLNHEGATPPPSADVPDGFDRRSACAR